MKSQEKLQEILETYGGEVANKSIKHLLADPQISSLNEYSEFIAKNWRDCFYPAMINLGCQVVGGNPKDTEDTAMGISLMNLTFRLWDDIIDETSSRTLKKTFVGKFGENVALVYGGVVSAKAFTIINKANLEPIEKDKTTELIWNYWAVMAKAETRDLTAKATEYTGSQKLDKIREEAINVQTALKIGAVIGKGSADDIEVLGTYGQHLAIMFELLKELKVSLNLTLELEKKIRTNQLPLLVLLAREESGTIKERIGFLSKKDKITPEDMGDLIQLLLDSKSWVHFTELFRAISEKCQDSLSTKNNNATKVLSIIAGYQSDSFWEIAKIKK
jgi:geranylgeranyl pyrophosphate synthase